MPNKSAKKLLDIVIKLSVSEQLALLDNDHVPPRPATPIVRNPGVRPLTVHPLFLSHGM